MGVSSIARQAHGKAMLPGGACRIGLVMTSASISSISGCRAFVAPPWPALRAFRR